MQHHLGRHVEAHDILNNYLHTNTPESTKNMSAPSLTIFIDEHVSN